MRMLARRIFPLIESFCFFKLAVVSFADVLKDYVIELFRIKFTEVLKQCTEAKLIFKLLIQLLDRIYSTMKLELGPKILRELFTLICTAVILEVLEITVSRSALIFND